MKNVNQDDLEENIIMMNNVKVYMKKDPDEDYAGVNTIEQLIDIEERKPGHIKNMAPKIYSKYLKEGKAYTLETYVKKNDRVKYGRLNCIPRNEAEGLVHTVEKIELSAIGSMAVVTAKLSNGDMCLTQYLEKV